MTNKHIWGIRLRVENASAVEEWLCSNLFFEHEYSHEGTCVRNGNIRLILEEEHDEKIDSYGPDDMCLGFRHIALETYDIQKAITYCKERNLTLQLGENDGPRYSGKVYGTGMNYFNIISGFGLVVEVSQKLHKNAERKDQLICGLEHVGLQVENVYDAVKFFEGEGFRREFDPVVNTPDGHTVECCMVSAADTVIELYAFTDLPNLPVQHNPQIAGLILSENAELYDMDVDGLL